MRAALLSSILGVGLFLTPLAGLQTAAAQTAAVTATCKDGSEFSGTTRSGACRGHKGVQTWGTASAAPGAASANSGTASPGIAPAAPPPARSASVTPAAPPPASIPSRSSASTSGSSDTAAKLGAPGQVWVNTSSKVYHCPGDRYYGKTKAGEFMSLSAAQAAGDRPSGGKACTS